ncbi:MAG TPA: hypothetical protein VMI72_12715 [Roseiarcus sp.]|nr:hypothetical protein [Roseiarcus sp.]
MKDRSPTWIGLADLLLCVLSVVIVGVAPEKIKAHGAERKAEYLLSSEWSVDVDTDVDIWLIPSSKKPVSYASRDVGCSKLDSDYRGFMDEIVTLADGSTVKVPSAKETISLRCIEPGHYDLGVNLYAYRRNGVVVLSTEHGLALPVHVEIVGVNPAVRLVFSKDVTLDQVGETINVVSFDLDRQGHITLADPPLEPVTARVYRSAGYPAGGAAP